MVVTGQLCVCLYMFYVIWLATRNTALLDRTISFVSRQRRHRYRAVRASDPKPRAVPALVLVLRPG